MKSLSGVGSGHPLVGVALSLIASILTIVGINVGVSKLRVKGGPLPNMPHGRATLRSKKSFVSCVSSQATGLSMR